MRDRAMLDRDRADPREEIEAKYARLVDADLGKWSKKNVAAFTEQLERRHTTAEEARDAWHAWRARDMQSEEMRLGHDEHRYAEDRNIAYAAVLDALLRKETGVGLKEHRSLGRTIGPTGDDEPRALLAWRSEEDAAFSAAMRRDRRSFEDATSQLPMLDTRAAVVALQMEREGKGDPLERAYVAAVQLERLIENRDSLVWLTHGHERDELMLKLREKTDPRELAAFIKEHPLVEVNYRRTMRLAEWVERPSVPARLEDWDPTRESLILRTDDRVPPLSAALYEARRHRETAEDDFQPHARGMGDADG